MSAYKPEFHRGRVRYYDVPIGKVLNGRDFDRTTKCRCGWEGIFGDCVPFRDSLGAAMACPACANPLLFYM